MVAWRVESHRWPAICIEPRQAKAAMGAMPNETDRNDARAIAQIMRTGWFRAVHVKTPACRSWRSLSVARRTVLNEMRTIENVVRAILLGPSCVKPASSVRRQSI
jgi:transposase